MTAHLFSYDPATRLLTGLLIPFGELSRPSVSGAEPVMFSAGTVALPRDPSVVTLNRRHDRFDPVGRAVELTETPAGVRAVFAIADTDEGDEYLTNEAGTLRKLSAELRGIVRDGARAVRSRLTGAALVDEGAFAGAALFAVADDDDAVADDDDAVADDDDAVADDDDAVADAVAELPGELVAIVNETASSSTAGTTETYKPTTDDDGDPADDLTPTPDEEETADMSNIVPGAQSATIRPSLDGMFAAIARNDPAQLAHYRAAGDLFALANLSHTGPSGVTIGADTGAVEALGELWARAPYQRRIVPLVQHATLTSWNMQGWQWAEGKSPTVEDYAGNTAEVPSNALDTVPVTVQAARLAGGHRIDRRFSDFNDQAVIASYLTHQTEDYKRKTDAKTLAAIVAAATVTTPGSVPANVARGLAAVIDGALDVIASENTPGYALVSPELWRDILLTPKDDVLAYLEAGFGFEEGTGPGFSLRPAAVGTGSVVVGAREALTFYELGETPIRVDGVVPGNGATDVAVFGYWATLTNNAKAIRKVTVAGAAG